MIRDEWRDDYAHEPCRPCGQIEREAEAAGLPQRDPSPEQLARDGEESLHRIQAIATNLTR